MAHYGLPPFRSAWGKLDELRVKLGKGVPFQALSGTQPPHIKKAILEKLLLDVKTLRSIELSSNRPNTFYATHQIVGELADFRNLDFLVPGNCGLDIRLRKTIVFHDNSSEASDAALYLDRRLPVAFRDKGIIRHYHGGMSKEYLTFVYEDFQKADGKCRILHATEGASTGLDISDIEVVIQYGITRDVPTTLQRGGRGGRTASVKAIFLIMYEPWVMNIELTDDPVQYTSDPDYPNGGELGKHSTKNARTGTAMVKLIQSTETCIRKFWAEYLNDTSPAGMF
ncbi:hypothetical protein CPC08DRAFT_642227 [Agrocybe pediades]|nr:hypothetical protein CPC08DRAFT_642227 [Agrocybe pediades]